MITITLRSYVGKDMQLYPSPLLPKLGYQSLVRLFTNYTPVDVDPEVISHCLRQTGSFSCSGRNGSMLRIEYRKDKW